MERPYRSRLPEERRHQEQTKVLVCGASGAIGIAAVQIAKSCGAEVTGACETADLECVRSLGADIVIDCTKEDLLSRNERLVRSFVANVGGSMCEHQMYIPSEKAAESVVKQLSSDSRLIVTGQIGCGKTTLARKISTLLALTHLEIDDFHDEPDPKRAAAEAAHAIDGGWVAEANVWQIPQTIWESSDFAVFLDYANWIHYLGIIRRCLGKCLMDRTWMNIQRTISDEFLHLKIVYLYANINRRDWHKHGGITSTTTPVIRCSSPRATNRLLACISTPTQM